MALFAYCRAAGGKFYQYAALIIRVRQPFNPAFTDQAIQHTGQCSQVDRQHFFQFNRSNTRRAADRAEHLKLCRSNIQRRQILVKLIDYNGDALRELVLRYAQEWALPEAFIQWLDQANSFCSTLVDRIVTGYPRDEVAKLEEELGYHDGFLDTAEHFYLFVIQGPKSLATELRLDKYPLNVLIVDDIKPYKERKVAILNGAHTALVPVAFQAGLDTVGEAMNDAEICAFVEKAIYEEIIPVLDLPRDELESFASAVTGRFRNPYIKHQLLSIALNGMTKFRTRILPQLLAGQKAKGTLPARLTFALAALIAFYRGERNGETYPVQDDAHWLERYQQLWSQHRDRVIGTQELVAIVLAEKDHWEQDLTQVPGLVEQVANDLDAILEKGMREAVRPLC